MGRGPRRPLPGQGPRPQIVTWEGGLSMGGQHGGGMGGAWRAGLERLGASEIPRPPPCLALCRVGGLPGFLSTEMGMGGSRVPRAHEARGLRAPQAPRSRLPAPTSFFSRAGLRPATWGGGWGWVLVSNPQSVAQGTLQVCDTRNHWPCLFHKVTLALWGQSGRSRRRSSGPCVRREGDAAFPGMVLPEAVTDKYRRF